MMERLLTVQQSLEDLNAEQQRMFGISVTDLTVALHNCCPVPAVREGSSTKLIGAKPLTRWPTPSSLNNKSGQQLSDQPMLNARPEHAAWLMPAMNRIASIC